MYLYDLISGYVSDDNILIEDDNDSQIASVSKVQLSSEDKKELSGQHMISDNVIHREQQMLKEVSVSIWNV